MITASDVARVHDVPVRMVLEPADPGYQHTVLYRRQSETRCGAGVPDRRGSTPPQIKLLPKCPGCYPPAGA